MEALVAKPRDGLHNPVTPNYKLGARRRSAASESR
jgi:hypothetical protein